MKKYLFTLMFVLFGASAVMGQETKVPDAFDCEEAYWITEMPDEYLIFPSQLMVYRLCNDTVIDGKVWKKMYSHQIEFSDIKAMTPDVNGLDYGNPVGCVHNDKGKIYGIVLNPEGFMHPTFIENKSPVLLYDFSKEVGDYVEIYDLEEHSDTYGEVIRHSEVLSDVWNGYERKYYIYYGKLVDGIGDVYNGPFGPIQLMVSGDNPVLHWCSADGVDIYGNLINGRYKYVYDLFYAPYLYNVNLYSSPKWIIGRVKDDKVVETYTLSVNGKNVVSSLNPTEKEVISFAWDYNNYFSNGKLYCKIGDTQHLLYNFKMQVGDTFDNGTKSMTVTSVDTMMIEGFERPVLTFDNGEQWIDGLGSTRGLLSPVTEDSEGYEEVLLSCVAGGTVMYVNPEYGSGINETEYLKSEIRLNGTVLEITAPEDASHTVVVYDAGGNAVVHKTFDGAEYTLSVSSLEQGVYIVAVDGIACGKIVL